ncbi:extracellular solute-binding protein [Herbivorax sp. ANBcel31]|uniref:extracellular solute-binding protein n=1 Tax=Herbivorax sp. ANBcel31 TaxID=3069754 RepID=UPI0027B1CA7C|nr:extracellular solute-binding protein [Herbivorax sp. ANBcel31]MDQ2085202.1 extracellular solute-binding protein [Herbivorax sp. ANBcel31]
MKLKKRLLCFGIVAVMMAGFLVGVFAGSNISTITAKINSEINYILNGEEFIPRDMDGSEMDTIIYSGRSYVPLRAISEALDMPVDWNDDTKTIILGEYEDRKDVVDEEKNVDRDVGSELTGEITIAHFNIHEANELVEAYMEKNPSVKVNIKHLTDHQGEYQNYIETQFKSNSAESDIIALECAFVREFVNMDDAFENLSEAPYNAEDFYDKLVPYTIDVGKSNDGKIRALSHQATPMGIGYKREIAREYLGTDNPEEISEMFSTSDKILETGRKLKAESGGKVKLFPHLEELCRIYMAARETGWEKDGKLVIDSKMDEFMELAKDLWEEGLVGRAEPWTMQWSNAIEDDEHFAWTMPNWGLRWIIISGMDGALDNPMATAGEWAVAKPEVTGFWGGTWLGINSNSENKDIAWDFIKFITLDEEHVESHAKKTGDFISNTEVISKLAEDDGYINPLTNQNLYEFYEPFLDEINGNLYTMYDDNLVYSYNIIESYMIAVKSYIKGEATKEDAIKKFKKTVYLQHGLEID